MLYISDDFVKLEEIHLVIDGDAFSLVTSSHRRNGDNNVAACHVSYLSKDFKLLIK